ncbi:uncharacterized mitochondrial protein AtMg00810-like [Vigna angularis]|uniref:uncharacterized mitochondrial protein AtMg00810-like n=1 Tax=Phaseolus angularis TaxID=3914 RepID=UPI00080A2435|nr:uncharacterized mitochondrial protein AtMg00810-like [Vigna angularis]
MGSIGFEKCVLEHGLYVKCCQHNGRIERLIVCLYVDDLLVTGCSEEMISEFKTQMLMEFEMSDFGRLNYFLGIEFTETECGIMMHQSRYVLNLLKKFFEMADCNAANTPTEVGLRLEKELEEEAVDPTTYRRMWGV